MRKFSSRFFAIIARLRASLEKVNSHTLSRVSVYVSVMLVSFLVAAPVFADGPTISDTILLTLAEVGIWVTGFLGKLILVTIQLLMPIMLYNSFSDSPVVSAGWAIVRDTVNMFFVIILIAIAFGTIFGSSRFNWQQQIVKLMIFAIVINFSKTLCGLMIDFGQIIMLTFANAIRSIAAGNFIQMFGLADAVSVSTQTSAVKELTSMQTSTGPAIGAFDWFASSFAAAFMMLIVLGTMLMLLVILLYRVVMLWILIVISPITWFVGGTQDIIHSDAYKTWWKKFTCLVAIGPVLTFFLWLTLVVAGGGTVGADSKIISQTDASGIGGTAGGFVTSLFQMNKLISFAISIAMLYAGFEAAQGVCHGAGFGAIDAMMKGGPAGNIGTRTIKGAVGMSAKIAGKGLNLGFKGGKKAAGWAARETGLTAGISNVKGNIYGAIAGAAGAGLIGKTIGRQAKKQQDKLAAERGALITAAGDKYKGDSRESKIDQLKRFAESPAMTVGGKRETQALLLEAMGDEQSMKELRADGSLEKLWAQHGGDLEKKAVGNHDLEGKLNSFKKKNADVTGSWDMIKTGEDVMALSAGALASKGAQENIMKIKDKSEFRGDKGEYLTWDEALRAGKLGKEKRETYEGGMAKLYANMNSTELHRVDDSSIAQNASAELFIKNPAIASRLMQSQDSKVRESLFTRSRSGKPEDQDFISHLSSTVGLDMATGAVTDEEKFKAALKQNPAMLNNLSSEAFKKLHGNEDSRRMTAEVLAEGKGKNLQSAIRDIKQNPNAAVNLDLASRIESIMSAADASPEVIEAAGIFNTHVSAANKGGYASRAVSAVSGVARGTMNSTMDDGAVSSAVAAVEKEAKLLARKAELEEKVSDGSTSKSELKNAGKELLKIDAQLQGLQANGSVESIASSPDYVARLDVEISTKQSALEEVNEKIAKNERREPDEDGIVRIVGEETLAKEKKELEEAVASLEAVQARVQQIQTDREAPARAFAQKKAAAEALKLDADRVAAAAAKIAKDAADAEAKRVRDAAFRGNQSDDLDNVQGE